MRNCRTLKGIRQRFPELLQVQRTSAHESVVGGIGRPYLMRVQLCLNSLENKNYRVSRATLYNTIELLLECGLVRKHQFGQNQAHYEKSYFDKQHDHVILSNGEVIEFCDPRIQSIKKTIEEVFNIEITNHSLYFYGNRKDSNT